MMTPFQAGMLKMMLPSLRARTLRPLWEPDGYSLPGYADWMPEDVRMALRWIEAHPTDRDPIDPAPNEMSLWMLTALTGLAQSVIDADMTEKGLLTVLPLKYLREQADKRRRREERRRRLEDRRTPRIARHVTVVDMTEDSVFFHTAEELAAGLIPDIEDLLPGFRDGSISWAAMRREYARRRKALQGQEANG